MHISLYEFFPAINVSKYEFDFSISKSQIELFLIKLSIQFNEAIKKQVNCESCLILQSVPSKSSCLLFSMFSNKSLLLFLISKEIKHLYPLNANKNNSCGL